MKCHLRENSLRVSGIKELSAANAKAFRDSCHGMISSVRNSIDVDLSETAALDSAGLGALLSLHKVVRKSGGTIRLVHPSSSVSQILELTRIHLLFEIVPPGCRVPEFTNCNSAHPGDLEPPSCVRAQQGTAKE